MEDQGYFLDWLNEVVTLAVLFFLKCCSCVVIDLMGRKNSVF